MTHTPAPSEPTTGMPLQAAVFQYARNPLSYDTLAKLASYQGLVGNATTFEPQDAIVMMVDDEPLNVEMTHAFLEEAGYRNFISTSDSLEAVDLMRRHMPHVILLDIAMPGKSGLDILDEIKDDKVLCHIPVIVLTSTTDAKTRLRALELGAMEFLHKPVDPAELALRLRNTLAARAHQDYLAHHDSLTGLPNRIRLLEQLHDVLAAAGQAGHGAALLHIGMDHFAQVNEALGRRAGDIMLRRIARRLRQCVATEEGGEMGGEEGAYPTLYRFDGDEFAVLVPRVEEFEVVAAFIPRLLEATAKSPTPSENDPTVTCSMGVAVFPDDGLDVEAIVNNAALALRQAKHNGRNTYDFYSPGTGNVAKQQLGLRNELRRAFNRGELTLLYTPKIGLADGKIVGIQTCIEWESAGRLIGTERTLEVAAQCGMTLTLLEWAMDQMAQQARSWTSKGVKSRPFALSLSLRHTGLMPIYELLSSAIRSGMEADQLVLDIQEASLVDASADDLRLLHDIRGEGVGLAIDDFAAQRSSLGMMRASPFTELKLHAGVVKGIVENASDTVIINTALRIAQAFNLTPTAKGVATPRHMSLVKSMGWENCEGGLFADPELPAPFARKWLF